MTEIYRKSIAKHIELYEELSPTATNDWELQKVTSMTLADNEAKADQLKSDIEWMQSEGFDAELIGDEQIYRMEPAIRGGMIAASVVNAGWELDSYSYTKSIASEAERRGLTITTGKVAALDTRGGRISSVTLADSKKIDTNSVVAATGPWANQIQGIPRLPVKPIKGEILRLSRPDKDLQNRIGFNGFNVGRKPNGSVLGWHVRVGPRVQSRNHGRRTQSHLQRCDRLPSIPGKIRGHRSHCMSTSSCCRWLSNRWGFKHCRGAFLRQRSGKERHPAISADCGLDRRSHSKRNRTAKHCIVNAIP